MEEHRAEALGSLGVLVAGFSAVAEYPLGVFRSGFL